MRLAWIGASLATSLIVLASLGPARTATPASHAQVTLYADTSTIVAGKPFTVAVAFKLDPKWHVYFKEPGDSGMPPEVKWNLPEGMTAGELQYPKPEVLKTPAGTNFVYHDEVWLLVTMTPGADFKIGRAVELSANVKWLECDADQCLPARGKASIKLTPDTRLTPTLQQQFDSWRAKVKEGESFDPAAAK